MLSIRGARPCLLAHMPKEGDPNMKLLVPSIAGATLIDSLPALRDEDVSMRNQGR